MTRFLWASLGSGPLFRHIWSDWRLRASHPFLWLVRWRSNSHRWADKFRHQAIVDVLIVNLRPHEVDPFDLVLLLDQPPESTPEQLLHQLRVVSFANEALVVDVDAFRCHFGLDLSYLLHGSLIYDTLELVTVQICVGLELVLTL